MVKVSIALPNNFCLTIEADEPGVIPELVGQVLRELPHDLIRSSGPALDGASAIPLPESINGGSANESQPRNGSSGKVVQPGSSGGPLRHAESSTAKGSPGGEGSATPEDNPFRRDPPGPAESAFIDFCRSANPLGDMRRVVVAAEGASRFLGASSVDAEQLSWLFDLAGWPRPTSLTQTLRNAARSKFRWLERIPGRSGHYAVTELGRVIAL